MNGDGSEDMDTPESSHISDARQLATFVIMLLEHPKMMGNKGTGLYETVLDQANVILKLSELTESCKSAEEFDVLLNLIRRSADNLAEALSLLRIP
jgi:hypothetical protein